MRLSICNNDWVNTKVRQPWPPFFFINKIKSFGLVFAKLDIQVTKNITNHTFGFFRNYWHLTDLSTKITQAKRYTDIHCAPLGDLLLPNLFFSNYLFFYIAFRHVNTTKINYWHFLIIPRLKGCLYSVSRKNLHSLLSAIQTTFTYTINFRICVVATTTYTH